MVNKNQQVQKIEREVIGPITIPEDLLVSMQKSIDLCVPATSKAVQTLNDSLVIANGLNELRAFFKNEDVKKLVKTIQDTTLGFLTDREPIALAKANAKKDSKWRKDPYTYEEIVEALIPPMLEGYKFTGNEINVISGNGMPVKRGKHRRINDMVKGFIHFIGAPVKAEGVAKIRCQAKWITDNRKEQSIGYGDDDKCVIVIEVGQYDGIDKLIGLAESKLFSRVLTRISGKLVTEGDVPHEEPKNITPEVDENKPSGKNIMQDDSPPKVSFVEKLTTVVDDSEYKVSIQNLIDDKKIKDPSELRSKDESKAKVIFENILYQKGFEESAEKES